MGVFYSRNRTRNAKLPPKVVRPGENAPILPLKPIDYPLEEDEDLKRFRRQLKHDVETFLLNNLLLSVQFFKNYEREIADLQISNVSPKEHNINTRLSEQQKHCLLPDTLHELVDKQVRFRPEHGPGKYHTESLHPQRMLIGYDNVEVHNRTETAEYSSALDGPIYKCIIGETELHGYVQLELKEIEQKNKKFNEEIFQEIVQPPSPAVPSTSKACLEENNFFNFKKYDSPFDPSPGVQLLDELKDSVDQPPKSPFKFPIKRVSTSSINSLDDDIFETKPIRKDSKQSSLTKTERRLSGVQSKVALKISAQAKPQFLRQASLPAFKSNNPITKNTLEVEQDSDYGYSTVTNHYTPKLLAVLRAGSTEINTTNLPNECITKIDVKVLRDEFDYKDQIEALKKKYPNLRDPRRVLRRPDLFESKQYLNSITFTAHFGDIFALRLGGSLGFSSEIVRNSMMQGAVIYSDVIEDRQVTSYEVTPALTCSWPDEAYEWANRVRRSVFNVRMKRNYKWPAQLMIRRARSLPSHIYPIGFLPKRGENIDRPLQWRLAFPAAERYLETCLSHAQVRCYMFTLAFYKSFMEPKTTKLGLNTDHIRTHLFWECERDCVNWPEYRLGEKLKIFFRHLRKHLEFQTLEDYFIPSRNLFENIPTKDLLVAHRKLADILENPVMYTIIALRNLKYRDSKFFPTLNYKELYSIIMSDNILEKINPQLRYMNQNDNTRDEAYDSADSDECAKPVDNNTRWNQEFYKVIQSERQLKTAAVKKRRASIDSINTEVKPTRVLEPIRLILILKLFIPHFIEMAKACNLYDATHLGLMYLKHAENLTTLLGEEEAAKEDAEEYLVQIRKLEDMLNTSLNNELLPRIPDRNVDAYANYQRPTKIFKPQILFGNHVESHRPNGEGISKYVNVEDLSKDRPNESNTDDEILVQTSSNLGKITVVDINRTVRTNWPEKRPLSLTLSVDDNELYESTDL